MSGPELASACVKVGRRATERREIVRYEGCDYYPRLPMFAALPETLGVSMDALWYARRRSLGSLVSVSGELSSLRKGEESWSRSHLRMC
jgi:hypothetical protein